MNPVIHLTVSGGLDNCSFHFESILKGEETNASKQSTIFISDWLAIREMLCQIMVYLLYYHNKNYGCNT